LALFTWKDLCGPWNHHEIPRRRSVYRQELSDKLQLWPARQRIQNRASALINPSGL